MKAAIQIAGIIDRAEADLLVAAGVEFIGFPLRLRDGREDLRESEAKAIIGGLPARVQAVVITYLDRAAQVLDLCDAIGVHWVQLHGPIDAGQLKRLRELRPSLSVIKSLIVRGDNLSALKAEVDSHADLVDAFITDTYDPLTGRTGATGRTHDWRLSRELVEFSPKPLILAGGLNPANVREAIVQVRPAAVDAHTGVEGADGRKDRQCVHEFVTRARTAFAQVSSV